MSRIQALVLAVLIHVPVFLAAQSTSLRPPITGIAKVSVYASDMGKSKQFYGDLLGFPPIGPSPAAAPLEYRVNSTQSIEVTPLPSGETDDLAYVAFATSNAESLRRYLMSRNIPVEGEIQTQANGARFFWVKDPEGHRIQFVQLPTRGRLLPIATTSAAATPEEPISHHILHAGFVVQNRAAEDHFFRDILGFREGWQGGSREGRTDWIDMQVPDGTDWIEYMMHDPAAKTASQSGVVNHFALGVPDIHQAANLLLQRHWIASARQEPQLGHDGKWQLNLYDPDGTRVELMEFGPVRTPCCSPYTLRPPKQAPN